MKTKHTPGPWVKDYNGSVGHVKAVCGMEYKGRSITPTICRYDMEFHWADDFKGPMMQEHQQANAHLIAAAPELLEACINLLEFSKECLVKIESNGIDYDFSWKSIISAKDAIKKATRG